MSKEGDIVFIVIEQMEKWRLVRDVKHLPLNIDAVQT